MKRRITTLEDSNRERMRLSVLRKYPGGLIGSHNDGTDIVVHQQEWHIDHAPTMEEVLSHKQQFFTRRYKPVTKREPLSKTDT